MGDPLSDIGQQPSGGPPPLSHLRMPDLERYLEKERRIAKEKREADIAALLKRIENGTSKIRIDWSWNDTRPRYVGAVDPVIDAHFRNDPAYWAMNSLQKQMEAETQERLRRETMGYLNDLAHTEAGFKLLSDLDASPLTTSLRSSRQTYNWTDFAPDVAKTYARADGSPGPGAAPRIAINPTLTSFVLPGEQEQPWMTQRVRYGLYHELVHAWHGTQGTIASGQHKGQWNAEWQAIGLGPWANDPVSENAIRREMGKELRPEASRVTY